MSWQNFKKNPIVGATVELRNKDFLNKRAIFVYLRELSGLNAKQLSVAMSNLRKYYREVTKSNTHFLFFGD